MLSEEMETQKADNSKTENAEEKSKSNNPNAKPKVKGVSTGKKYKKVADKVKPVLGTLPSEFRIEREIRGDPLAGLPVLPERPPEFTPRGRYTEERKEALDKLHSGEFLWPEERKLQDLPSLIECHGE